MRSLAPDDEGYYFAYGGCNEGPSGPGIQVIDGLNAREWAETENGKLFQHLFLRRCCRGMNVNAVESAIVATPASRLLYRDGRCKTASGSPMKNGNANCSGIMLFPRRLLARHRFRRMLQTTCRT